MLAENFRKNMTDVMTQKGLSVSDVADLMGSPTARDWVRRVRKGEVQPTLLTVEKISEALGVDSIAMMEEW